METSDKTLMIKGNNLKEQLDYIDQQVIINYGNKYGGAMGGKYIGDWWKGKAIGETPRGSFPSWRQLEKETGRDHKSLKKWHDLYKQYEDDFTGFIEEYVKPKVDKLSRSWIKGMLRKALPGIEEPQKIMTTPQICLESYKDWLPKQEDCDLLLTDPPFITDIDNIDEFAQDWLPMALNKVKITGRAYIFIGAYPKEVKTYLNIDAPNHLILDNLLIWTYKNTLGVRPDYRYIQNYQMILYFRGKKSAKLYNEVIMEQISVQEYIHPARSKDRKFEWQKPDELAEMFIRHSTRRGDLVLDPFAGCGTFLVAAGKFGRKARGCEIKQSTIEIAEERGCKIYE